MRHLLPVEAPSRAYEPAQRAMEADRSLLRAIGGQGRQHRIRRVAQLVCDALNTFAGRGRNARMALERERDRRAMNAGAPGNLFLGGTCGLHAGIDPRNRKEAIDIMKKSIGAAGACPLRCAQGTTDRPR